MSWVLSIEHASHYRYSTASDGSFNEARMLPQSDRTQLVLERSLVVTPSAHILGYQDYWGTLAHVFEIHQPHQELSVIARSRVQTGTAAPTKDASPPWQQYRDPVFDDTFAEFLDPTLLTLIKDTDEAAQAIELLRGSPTPLDAAQGVAQLVHERLTYEVGSTAVSTSADEAWSIRKGVCQDFAHLCIALLRRLGIPARYVSGYYYPDREESIGEVIDAESHAWVEAWVGSWLPLDPTNQVVEPERYVVVGRGRDYTDVPPLIGIYSGNGTSTMEVRVRVIRES
ncbi:transglutaminase family protein [Ferrimicrobium sp.]|uniref:transglutaminase family protein n=1 Tax=Ferrimicrobium sp. TaxID=2926050 RepID=UPI00261572ED|nr:transglutaminase family protein [Ferrimicrobium sp.]